MTTTILPFPAPDGLARILGNWPDIAIVLRLATKFRGMPPAEATAMVREALCIEAGAEPMAHMLEQIGAAVTTLRSAAAELAGVDRLLATAADHVLAEAGL